MKFKDLTLSTFSSAFRRLRKRKGLDSSKEQEKNKGNKNEK